MASIPIKWEDAPELPASVSRRATRRGGYDAEVLSRAPDSADRSTSCPPVPVRVFSVLFALDLARINFKFWRLNYAVEKYPYIPQYKFKNAVKLKERGYKYYPMGKYLRSLGKLRFYHGHNYGG